MGKNLHEIHENSVRGHFAAEMYFLKFYMLFEHQGCADVTLTLSDLGRVLKGPFILHTNNLCRHTGCMHSNKTNPISGGTYTLWAIL